MSCFIHLVAVEYLKYLHLEKFINLCPTHDRLWAVLWRSSLGLRFKPTCYGTKIWQCRLIWAWMNLVWLVRQGIFFFFFCMHNISLLEGLCVLLVFCYLTWQEVCLKTKNTCVTVVSFTCPCHCCLKCHSVRFIRSQLRIRLLACLLSN